MFYQVHFIIFILLLGDSPSNLEVDVDYTKELVEGKVSNGIDETESVNEVEKSEEKSEEISASVEVKKGEKEETSEVPSTINKEGSQETNEEFSNNISEVNNEEFSNNIGEVNNEETSEDTNLRILSSFSSSTIEPIAVPLSLAAQVLI